MSAPQSPRVLSWQQLVLEADTNWQRDNLQPWIYEFSNRRLFYATIPMYGQPTAGGLINDGGFLMLVDDTGWPKTDTGLPPGSFFSNGLFVNLTAGATPSPPSTPPLIFPGLSVSGLLTFGPGTIVNSPQTPGSGQLFLQGGFVCVA